jgi:hypothetical protein
MGFVRWTGNPHGNGKRKSRLAGMEVGQMRPFTGITRKQLYQWVYNRRKTTGEGFEFMEFENGIVVRRYE